MDDCSLDNLRNAWCTIAYLVARDSGCRRVCLFRIDAHIVQDLRGEIARYITTSHQLIYGGHDDKGCINLEVTT